MDYVMKPSLERIALVKIAVTLWNQDDVSAAVTTLPQSSFLRCIEWLKIEDKVIGKVPGLLLPESLKKKVLKFISGIGREIFKWREYLYEVYRIFIVPPVPSDFCWTPHGTVDIKKMVEAFIQNENIDVTHRYRLACHYCLEDNIPKLWNKIPKNLREQFGGAITNFDLVVFWTHRIKRGMDKLYHDEKMRWGSPPYHAKFAAVDGGKAATEYFLQRLTLEEREELVLASAKLLRYINPSIYFPNVLCFLFSQMDERKQRIVFKECPVRVLKCLLEWPWQFFFMETANRMWDFLSKKDFYTLLTEIVCVQSCRRDYDYQKLFAEFWQQSPNAHKKRIIDKLKRGNLDLLSDLFKIKDIKNVSLILKSATVEERKHIVASPSRDICKYLVKINEWDSLKLFFQEFLSSKEEMIQFKEKFKEHMVCKILAIDKKYSLRYKEREGKKGKWKKCLQILDYLIQDNNKRSVEEAGESTLAKRLCDTTEFEDITHDMKKIDMEERPETGQN